MKNKMMKILGIALTLAVLVGLLLPAMPVSAGTMSWSTEGMPGNLSEDTSIDVFAFAPDGKTLFAWDCDNEEFLKSLDAGASWLPPGKVGEGVNDPDDELGIDLMAIAVSPRYATDDIVVALSWDGDFFYSEDGGKTFEADWEGFSDVYGLPANMVTSLDISYTWNDKLAIVVGARHGMVMHLGKDWRWVYADIERDDNDTIIGETDFDWVLDVAFAPDYADSDRIVALVATDYDIPDDGIDHQTELWSGRIDSDKTLVDENYSWSQPVSFKTPVSDAYGMDGHYGFMAFPSDYDSSSNAIVFVGIEAMYDNVADNAWYATLEAYRADLKGDTGVATNLRLDKKLNAALLAEGEYYIDSLDYKGTSSSGTLAVSISGEMEQIYISTNADTVDGAASWSKPKKGPYGEDFMLAFSPTNDNLYVGSSNYEGFGSAFYVSSDYDSFNGISRISVDSLEAGGLSFGKAKGLAGSATQYLIIKAEMGEVDAQILFKSTDTGKTWTEIFAAPEADIADMAISGDVIYLIKTDGGYQKSTNAGVTFGPPSNFRHDIQSFALIDADNYFYASDDVDIYKNDSRTPITLDSNGKIGPMVFLPGFYVVVMPGDNFWVSTDSGVTFKELRDSPTGANVIDGANKTIYAVDANSVLFKYVVGTSTDWEKIQTLEGVYDEDKPPFELDPKSLNMTSDGAWYALVDVGEDAEDWQMWRSVDINGPVSFEPIPGSAAEDLFPVDEEGGFVGKFDLASGTKGNTIYAQVTTTEKPAPGKGMILQLKSFTDSMVAAPAPIAPLADAQVGKAVFQWGSVDGGKSPVTYELEATTTLDSAGFFKGVIQNTTTSALMSDTFSFTPGLTYYWHVRTAGELGKTLTSKWSQTIKFVIKLTEVNSGDSTWIAPAAGATGVSQTPNFQWGSVTGATGYELVIDGGAAIKLTDTVYTLPTPLAYGSTHTWKVRAVSGTTASDWISGVFTVMAAPPPPPASPPPPAPKYFDANSGQYFDTQAQLDAFQAQWKINHPTPEPPSTPAYIWVIIVIAAILVIAVIVLIARTRRV